MRCAACGSWEVQELRLPCNLVEFSAGTPATVYLGIRYGCRVCYHKTVVNSGKVRLSRTWPEFEQQFFAMRNNECCHRLLDDGTIGARL